MTANIVRTKVDAPHAELAERARCMRKHVIRMTDAAGSGHPGPAFSIVDMVATLYFSEMRYDPQNPNWLDRDRFVLSKGHSAPGLYAALYEAGFFSEEVMLSLRRPGSPLQGHPDAKMDGIDATSGSLGTGFSQALGMAMGAKMRGSASRVYALLGDGECDEGQIWEAALAAPHFKLDNLTVFIDFNKDQFEAPVSEVMNLEPLADKWFTFGWRVEEINGHDFYDILGFLERSRQCRDKPSIAIAHTLKGYGVSFMSGNHAYHARALKPEESQAALAELDSQAPNCGRKK